MEGLKKELPALYGDIQRDMKLFKRESYQEHFEEYRSRNQAFFMQIRSLLLSVREDGDAGRELMEDIAQTFVGYAQELVEQEKGKIARENLQLNLNMVTVIYIIPAMKEPKDDMADELAEIICNRWNSAFRGNRIKPSDYQSIQDGFRSKLCYITTAVCRSLHKPVGCYELSLLEEYRDGYLKQSAGGDRMIKEYYNIAPTIVKRIEKSGEAEEKYRFIWEHYLKPCVKLIEGQRNEECRALYQEMVESLHKEYMEDYHG